MKITPLINGVVVAPHGITDLFHAYEYNNINNLIKIYLGSLIFMEISNFIQNDFHNIQLLDSVFFSSSICHFKHDMPFQKKNKITSYILSIILVSSTYIISIDVFTIYMALVHVPRHYIKCWNFIKNKNLLLMSIILLSYPGYYVIDNLNNLNKDIISIIEAVIIGHVIYNEKYIDNLLLDNR